MAHLDIHDRGSTSIPSRGLRSAASYSAAYHHGSAIPGDSSTPSQIITADQPRSVQSYTSIVLAETTVLVIANVTAAAAWVIDIADEPSPASSLSSSTMLPRGGILTVTVTAAPSTMTSFTTVVVTDRVPPTLDGSSFTFHVAAGERVTDGCADGGSEHGIAQEQQEQENF